MSEWRERVPLEIADEVEDFAYDLDAAGTTGVWASGRIGKYLCRFDLTIEGWQFHDAELISVLGVAEISMPKFWQYTPEKSIRKKGEA